MKVNLPLGPLAQPEDSGFCPDTSQNHCGAQECRQLPMWGSSPAGVSLPGMLRGILQTPLTAALALSAPQGEAGYPGLPGCKGSPGFDVCTPWVPLAWEYSEMHLCVCSHPRALLWSSNHLFCPFPQFCSVSPKQPPPCHGEHLYPPRSPLRGWGPGGQGALSVPFPAGSAAGLVFSDTALCFQQGTQGPPGPKGDPGAYGPKGGKVSPWYPAGRAMGLPLREVPSQVQEARCWAGSHLQEE